MIASHPHQPWSSHTFPLSPFSGCKVVLHYGFHLTFPDTQRSRLPAWIPEQQTPGQVFKSKKLSQQVYQSAQAAMMKHYRLGG